MLTKKDIATIGKIIETELELILGPKIEEKTSHLVTKEDLKYLPTKDNFYEKMDEVMGELKAIREENAILNGRTSDHEERITKLEELHPHHHSQA